MSLIQTRSVCIHDPLNSYLMMDLLDLVVFLERLQSYPQLPLEHVIYLGELYKLSASSNAEIRLRFYQVALIDYNSPSAKAFAGAAVKWVVGDDGTGIIKGRMKFCRPVFRAVGKVDRQMAIKVFEENQDAFHPIARKMIERVCFHFCVVVRIIDVLTQDLELVGLRAR